MKSKKRSKFLYLLVSLGVIVIDQISKYFAGTYLNIYCNTGGVFGLVGNFVPIGVAVLILVFSLTVREQNRLNIFGFALIFGGGLSNFYDRIILGCVRDFINLGWFPSFNLADSAITVGVVLILFNLIFGKYNKEVHGS